MRGHVALLLLSISAGALPAQGAEPEDSVGADLGSLERDLVKLRGSRQSFTIVRIANEGARARRLWPKLVAVLGSGPTTEQACAALALGWIGATEGIPALTKALSSRDWPVVHAAAGALGSFGGAAKAALEDLQEVEGNHWMTAVRQRAKAARQAIEHPELATRPGPHVKDPLQWERDLEAFYDGVFGLLSGDPCGIRSTSAVKIGEQWFDVPSNRDDWRHQREMRASLPEALAKHLKLWGKLDIAGVIEVPNGWLVGIDGGEWGGDLRFVDAQGKKHVLLPRNTRSLIKSGSNVYAIAQAAFALRHSRGDVLLVTPKGPRRWQVQYLTTLPAHTIMAVPLDSGGVLVLSDYGAVSVAANGTVREEACPERLSDQVVLIASPSVAEHPNAGIRPSAVTGRVDDALAVLGQVLNHPRVLPFFHLELGAAVRIEVLPAPLRDRPIQVRGHDVTWAAATAPDAFRFLDLAFDGVAAATVAFTHPSEGMEGYAVLEKQNGTWQVVGITVVEK